MPKRKRSTASKWKVRTKKRKTSAKLTKTIQRVVAKQEETKKYYQTDTSLVCVQDVYYVMNILGSIVNGTGLKNRIGNSIRLRGYDIRGYVDAASTGGCELVIWIVRSPSIQTRLVVAGDTQFGIMSTGDMNELFFNKTAQEKPSIVTIDKSNGNKVLAMKKIYVRPTIGTALSPLTVTGSGFKSFKISVNLKNAKFTVDNKDGIYSDKHNYYVVVSCYRPGMGTGDNPGNFYYKPTVYFKDA